MGDEEGSGMGLGKFGAMLGKGAAKAGKKAAQSEAGRRAGRAAVKGACDGVRDDMLSRYSNPTSPTTPTPATPVPATPTSAPAVSTPTSKDKMEYAPDTTEPEKRWFGGDGSSMAGETVVVKRTHAPPKPSLFGRLLKRDKESDRAPRRQRAQVDPKDRIYKQRLAKDPDWDRKQMARALYNFQGEMKCDLVFRKGQIIQVLTRTEDQNDWWEGKLEDRVGIFPANYVKLM